MIVGDDLGSPGKTYEYIGAGKPILGLVPEGFLKNTILEAGGTVVPPTDVRGDQESDCGFLRRSTNSISSKVPAGGRDGKVRPRALTGSLVRIFRITLMVP